MFNPILFYTSGDSACKAFKNRVKKHAHYKRRIPSPRNVRKLTSTEKATEGSLRPKRQFSMSFAPQGVCGL